MKVPFEYFERIALRDPPFVVSVLVQTKEDRDRLAGIPGIVLVDYSPTDPLEAKLHIADVAHGVGVTGRFPTIVACLAETFDDYKSFGIAQTSIRNRLVHVELE
jgi:hypothetical protein